MATVTFSPSAIANTAASAPSVEATGDTTPTLPIRSARYIIDSPPTDAKPPSTAHAQALAPASEGMPSTASASGTVSTVPQIST